MPKTCDPVGGSLDIISGVELHQPALKFELRDLQGRLHRLGDYLGKIVILNFWSAECPISEQTDHHLIRLVEKWKGELVLLPIASNRTESIQMLERAVQARGLPVVLIDAEHSLADLYEAQTTPHAFVLDRQGLLRYRGAVDDVTFRKRKATRFFVEEAVEALLAGRLPEVTETPAYGCTIVREI